MEEALRFLAAVVCVLVCVCVCVMGPLCERRGLQRDRYPSFPPSVPGWQHGRLQSIVAQQKLSQAIVPGLLHNKYRPLLLSYLSGRQVCKVWLKQCLCAVCKCVAAVGRGEEGEGNTEGL